MLKQTIQQKLLQKLSPQQIQLMKLLQVPTVELEQRIKEEIESNPALEEGREDEEENADDTYDERDEEFSENGEADLDFSDYMDEGDLPSYKLHVSNQGKDDETKDIPFASGQSFQDYLESQIQLKDLNEKQMVIAHTIIGNLDESGYLRRELENIVNDLAFSQNIMTTPQEVEDVLFIVQNLDPAGIAARNLKECLLLQIERKDDRYPSIAIAREVLSNHFDAFTKKHYDKILRKLDIEDEDLKLGIEEITRLNPKPGNSVKESNKAINQVIPDFIITSRDGDLQLTLNGRNAPDLKVSKSYREMLESYSKTKDKKSKDAILFVKQKIDSAKWFIEAIKQRQQTLLLTMSAIMEYQRDYFLTGDETKLKPMILKDIAEIVDMDISTVSRVANSKYAQTDYGTFLLKTFFSESLSTDTGEEVSTREVKKILQDGIEGEDKKKPLTDEKLAKLLKDKGYNIARRTVAKYREQLNIPVARLRKQL